MKKLEREQRRKVNEQKRQQIFEHENIKTLSLSNYSSLIEIALEKKIITEDDVALLKSWRENPSEWGK